MGRKAVVYAWEVASLILFFWKVGYCFLEEREVWKGTV